VGSRGEGYLLVGVPNTTNAVIGLPAG